MSGAKTLAPDECARDRVPRRGSRGATVKQHDGIRHEEDPWRTRRIRVVAGSPGAIGEGLDAVGRSRIRWRSRSTARVVEPTRGSRHDVALTATPAAATSHQAI